MPIQEELLELILQSSLPKHARFGLENFAGDDDVADFFKWAKEYLSIAPHIYVAWATEPGFFLLKSNDRPIVVRSERLDPLLAEFLIAMDSWTDKSNNIALQATISRWCAEILLVQGKSLRALDGLLHSHYLSESRYPLPWARDELLASIEPLRRFAVQCFALTHELAHVVGQPVAEAVDLSFKIDGLPIFEYLKRDFVEVSIEDIGSAMNLIIGKENIPIKILVDEIKADALAIQLIFSYIVGVFSVDPKQAMKVCIEAFTALSYFLALRQSCALLGSDPDRDIKEFDFEDLIISSQISIRTRCIMRRAGFLLAEVLNPDKSLTAALVNECVEIMDHIASPQVYFLAKVAELTHSQFFVFRNGITISAFSGDWNQRFEQMVKVASAKCKYDATMMIMSIGHPLAHSPFEYFKLVWEEECRRPINR